MGDRGVVVRGVVDWDSVASDSDSGSGSGSGSGVWSLENGILVQSSMWAVESRESSRVSSWCLAVGLWNLMFGEGPEIPWPFSVQHDIRASTSSPRHVVAPPSQCRPSVVDGLRCMAWLRLHDGSQARVSRGRQSTGVLGKSLGCIR